MTLPTEGDEVLVTAAWSTFFRRRGRVVRVSQRGAWVVLEDEECALAMRIDEVTVLPSERPIGGAE